MTNYHTNNHLHVTDVTLMVKNLNTSLDFYTKILGLKVIEQTESKAILGTHTNHVLLHLIENKNALPKLRTTGLYHYALLFRNRADLGQILKHFIRLKQMISGGADHGISEAIYLDDPDGNGIELAVDRDDYKYKYTPAGEIDLLADNLPMDYEDLITKANPEPYTKIPDDTIMGHLHLHVANMDSAKHFFIDLLGFQSMFNYQANAHFISDQKYHHHVAFNLWNGRNISNNPVDAVGLKAYTLNVPQSRYEGLINHLIENNITIQKEKDINYIVDVNDVKVYLKSQE